MAWVGKDHNAHLIPTPCYVHGRQPADQAAQSHILPGLECLPGWGIYNLLGQPGQCVTTLWGKNFLISNVNLPCLSLKPFPLVLSLSTLLNNRSPSCLYALFKYWKAAMRSPHSLLFSKLNKPSSLNLGCSWTQAGGKAGLDSCLCYCGLILRLHMEGLLPLGYR